MLAQKLLELAGRSGLGPRDVAAILASELGPARKTTPFRTDYDLAATELIAGGHVATGGAWLAVSLKPAALLGLALQDLEPHFLDCPYSMDVTTAHFPDGLAIRSLNHCFLVKAGMLVVSVPPHPPSFPTYAEELDRAYGERWETIAESRSVRDPVMEIALTNKPQPGLEKEVTLRTFREQARKAAGRR